MRIWPGAFICLVIFLPMATFAYADEWDDLLQESKQSDSPDGNKNRQNQPDSQLHQVKRLDQEIMILRAEMSQKHGDVKQVEQYLNQLDKQSILPGFKARIERLRKYVLSIPKKNSSFLSFFSSVKSINFPMHDKNAVVAIVLPDSGVYGSVGASIQKALQEGLKQAGFEGKLIALDLAIYDSAFEAWEVLKYYDPSFIFGPLQKEKIAQWQELKTGVQTLYFNDVTSFTNYEFGLSPGKQAGLEQVFQVLNQADYGRVLVLTEPEQSSQELEQAFSQAWSNYPLAENYTSKVVEKTVGQAIDDGLNINKSKARKSWLQRVLGTHLKFSPRARKDIDAVISFLPQNLAIQVAPYLNFITNSKPIAHIWYPSKTPSANYVLNHLDAWQETFAVLPLSLSTKITKNHSNPSTQTKNGLFYALGRVAVEIVKSSNLTSDVDTLIETANGTYIRDANGQFTLLPDVYWADDGVFEKFVNHSE